MVKRWADGAFWLGVLAMLAFAAGCLHAQIGNG